jgi:hypothetical protein
MSLVNRKLFSFVLLLLATVAFTAPKMQAQTNYGAVRGTAKDTQGAVIPDAEVTLTNVGTKIVRTSKTNGAGDYEFSQVSPGDYVIGVTLKGFKGVKEAATVELGDTATVDAILQVGSATETVEVQTSEPLIDTASASGGQNFTSQQLTDLPNLGRNPFVFEKLDNNVTPVGDPRFVRAEDQSGSTSVSIAGAPIGANSYVVDGIPVSTSSGGVTFIPSPEAVSSSKTQANAYDAEVGRTGGGVGNTSLKSGTATYHGVLYGETRQTSWSANSWSDKHTYNVPNAAGVVVAGPVPRPDVTTYLYAAALGGPIPFSNKVKYLKDTFFYVTEEGYRQAQPDNGSGSLLVPTAAEVGGDFTGDFGVGQTTATPYFGGTNGVGNTFLFDPTSPISGTTTCPKGDSGPCHTLALVGIHNGVASQNVIPASYVNNIGKWTLNNAYPSTTVGQPYIEPGSSTGLNWYGTANSLRGDDFKTRSDMYSGKLDHTFTPWMTSAASYVHLATQEPSGDYYGNKGNFSSDGRLVRFNDATSVYSVFTINPTTVATVGYGFNRYWSDTFPYALSFNLANGFGGTGFPASFVSQIQDHVGGNYVFPQISASGFASLGSSYSTVSVQDSHNLVIGLVKTVGKQNLKGGYVYRALHISYAPVGANPSFTFNGGYTSADGNSANTAVAGTTASVPGALTGSGSTIADLLLGTPSSASVGLAEGYFNSVVHYHALYFQDDFRANAKLTLNLGLRYEYELGTREQNNQTQVGFDKNATNLDPFTGTVFHGGIAWAGINGYPVHAANQSHTKFSPRVGAAYELRKGTVLQAGFGVFYAPEAISTTNTGYTQSTAYAPGGGVGLIPQQAVTALGNGSTNFLNNPFPGGEIQPYGNSLGNLSQIGTSVSVIDFARRDPLVEQYSVRVEHQLPWGTALTLGYVGAHSKNFAESVNINQLSDGVFAQLAACAAGNASFCLPLPGGTTSTSTTNYSKSIAGTTNPWYYPTITAPSGIAYGTGTITASTTAAAGQYLLPYPQYSTVTLSESTGYSLYNAFNVKVVKRATKGLTLLFGYTWASNWDNLFGGGSSLNGTNGPADNYNLKGEYARAVNDLPNRYTAGITYALPVGRGMQFFSNMPRILDYVVGGYTIDAIIIRQDGGPLSITQATNYSTKYGVTGFGGTVRPNFAAGGPSPCFSGAPQTRSGWQGSAGSVYFNAAAFAGTPAFTYGNVPRTLPCKGPGLSNTDLNVSKTFPIGEHVKVKFLAEALNVTNTTEFGLSSTAIATNGSGPSSPAGGAPALAIPSENTTGGGPGQLTQLNYSRFIQLGGRIIF